MIEDAKNQDARDCNLTVNSYDTVRDEMIELIGQKEYFQEAVPTCRPTQKI